MCHMPASLGEWHSFPFPVTFVVATSELASFRDADPRSVNFVIQDDGEGAEIEVKSKPAQPSCNKRSPGGSGQICACGRRGYGQHWLISKVSAFVCGELER